MTSASMWPITFSESTAHKSNALSKEWWKLMKTKIQKTNDNNEIINNSVVLSKSQRKKEKRRNKQENMAPSIEESLWFYDLYYLLKYVS